MRILFCLTLALLLWRLLKTSGKGRAERKRPSWLLCLPSQAYSSRLLLSSYKASSRVGYVPGFSYGTMPDPETGREPSEDERTVSWVEERFRELGFNDRQAAVLADARADWHEAKRMLDRGCPHLDAVDILT